ncbi:MAG: hypothetical protein Q7K41_01220 [Dehalococcoidales bacterium]|nr:hypothetical protein [Dehalococcoidales bacterium]
MKRQYKLIIVALGVVAILITAVTTTAFAAQKVNTPGTSAPRAVAVAVTPVATGTEADYQAWGCPVANGNYEAIASLLGMTPQDIEIQQEQGKSLVEIAAAKGVSEDKLVSVIFDQMKQYMQQQVTTGTWTQAQMDSHLTLAEQHVRQLVNAKGNDADSGGCGGNGGMMGGNSGMMSGNSGMMGGNSGIRSNGGMMGGNNGIRSNGGMMGSW